MPKSKKYLSASRLNTLEECSWKYWCNYHLGLPKKGNDGMYRGTVCHLILEVLLDARHKEHYERIVEAKTIQASKAIEKLIIKHLKRLDIFNDENFEMVDEMIVVGLNQNFFAEGAKLLEPELQFEIDNENPTYTIFGFIDKTAQLIKERKVIISDYKTSKSKFKGEKLESNVQAMMYSLVAKKLWPKMKPVVEFVFLRFPRKPIQRLEFSDDALKGFEYYLEKMYKMVLDFSEKDAETNFAADNPRPRDGSWGGSLNCGFAREQGQLKKDGTLMWHCDYKFPFDYFVLKDKEGKVKDTSFANNFNPKDDETVEEAHYSGCPRHNNDIWLDIKQ